MGCCSSSIETIIASPENYFNQTVQKKMTIKGIELVSSFDRLNPDKIIVKVQSIQTNALGLSILLSDAKFFKYLHSHLNCSFDVLEDQLQTQNIQLIQLLIDNFNPEIMRYYIPFYLDTINSDENLSLNSSIKPGSSSLLKIRNKMHPMRYAAENENLEFIKFIVNYFKGKTVPDCFDVHSIDNETGENCALVACRFGCLKIVEYLHELKCDFRLVNNNGENAINLTLVSKPPGKGKISVLPYLIEIIGLDITKNYEETLILSRNSGITGYIEEKLKQRKIFVSKLTVETMYGLNVNYSTDKLDSQSKQLKSPSNMSLISPIEPYSSVSLVSPYPDI